MAHNYILTPTVVNEVRTGFNGNHTGTNYGITSAQIVSDLGLVGIPQPYSVGGNLPNFIITGFQQTGGTAFSISRNNTFQVLDTLTWTKGSHTLKFGGDYRRMSGYYSNVFASSRLGQYTYSGSVTGSNGSGLIGNPYAASCWVYRIRPSSIRCSSRMEACPGTRTHSLSRTIGR